MRQRIFRDGAAGAHGMTIANGIVRRHGQPCGPGNSPSHGDAAAYAALLAVDRGAPEIYDITDNGAEPSHRKAIRDFGWTPDFRLEALP